MSNTTFKPTPWSPSKVKPYSFDKPHENLNPLTFIPISGDKGPEHMIPSPDDETMLYAGLLSGAIVILDTKTKIISPYVNTGGRPLGLGFDNKGNLLIADSKKGFLSVSKETKEISILCTTVNDGTSIGYPNGVVGAKNGKIYFTDSSLIYPTYNRNEDTFAACALDLVAHSGTGRILEYNPDTKVTAVLMDGLNFANGIVLSQDEQFIIVAECGAFRIVKIRLNGKKYNASELSATNTDAQIIVDNLPGYPDNLNRGQDGRVWMGFTKSRTTASDLMNESLVMRELILSTLGHKDHTNPSKQPKQASWVVAINDDGTVVSSIKDLTESYQSCTGLVETKDQLWLASEIEDKFAYLNKSIV